MIVTHLGESLSNCIHQSTVSPFLDVAIIVKFRIVLSIGSRLWLAPSDAGSLLGHSFHDMFGKRRTQRVGRITAEMNVLALPPFCVPFVVIVFHKLPLVTDSDFGVTFDDFQCPRVEVGLHDARSATGCNAFLIQFARLRVAVGNGTGGDPDQLGFCLLERDDNGFEIALVRRLVAARKPLS